MKRPETETPEIVLVIDEVEALEDASVPTGLRVHLDRVLVQGRAVGPGCPAVIRRPVPAWLDAGELAALTSALVAGQVRQAGPPA